MSREVVIIGAGAAGVAAALRLAKKNFHVKVLEAKNFVGGRMFSFRDKTSGEVIDNGQHLLSGAYSVFLSILDELGTSLYLQPSGRLKVNFADAKGEKYILDTSVFPGNLGVISGLIRFNAVSFQSKMQLINFFIKLKRNKIDARGISCLQLLKSENQSDELIYSFWEPLILAVLNNKPEHTEASLLLKSLKKAFFSSGRASELILPVRDLSYLLAPFAKRLKNLGGELFLNKAVNNIVIENGKIQGVEMHNGEIINVDNVISTVQPHILQKLIPPAVTDFDYLKKFNYSTIINIYYWLDKHIETNDFTALLGTKSQWIFNRRNFTDSTVATAEKFPGLVNITISGADELAELPAAELKKLCFAELQQNMKEFRSAKILHSRVIKDKFSTFSASPETENLRPASKTEIQGLFLAGDWTNTELPATIESAALSGEKAAAEIEKTTHIIH